MTTATHKDGLQIQELLHFDLRCLTGKANTDAPMCGGRIILTQTSKIPSQGTVIWSSDQQKQTVISVSNLNRLGCDWVTKLPESSPPKNK